MNRNLWSLIPVLALVLVSGCAEREVPTAITQAVPEAPSFSSTSADLSRLATFQQRPKVTIAWAKKWIGPEGGRLEFQGFAIDVPAGAVDKVTQFSIRLPVEPKRSERVVAEFGPHNRQFRAPVTIEFPYAGTSVFGAPGATIVWWNAGWVDMGATVTEDGSRLRTQTDHFSTYGTTDTEDGTVEARGGTVTTSGG